MELDSFSAALAEVRELEALDDVDNLVALLSEETGEED